MGAMSNRMNQATTPLPDSNAGDLRPEFEAAFRRQLGSQLDLTVADAVVRTLSDAGARGRLSSRHLIAVGLRVTQLFQCDDWFTALESEGHQIGLAPSDLKAMRSGVSDDPREQALLALVSKLVMDRGHNSGFALEVAQRVGISHDDVVEVAALLAMHSFVCCLFNLRLGTEEAGGLGRDTSGPDHGSLQTTGSDNEVHRKTGESP